MPADYEDGLPFEDVTDTDKAATAPPLLGTRSLLDSVLGDLGARHKTKQGGGWTGGLRCGIPLIDNGLRGLRPATITILNAEPNVGKSTLSNQIAFQTAAYPKQSAAALYVSFENDPTDLILKHLARMSGWAMSDLETGEISPEDRNLLAAANKLTTAPLFYIRGNAATSPGIIIERSLEALEVSGAERLLLVIDYLQYFARFAAGKMTTDKIGMALTELGGIADKTQASLLVIGSQNRTTNKDGDASMYGGRGSGEIEYDADNLLSLTKDEKGISVAGGLPRRLTAVKTRFGGAGATNDFNFYPDRAFFESQGGNDGRNTR